MKSGLATSLLLLLLFAPDSVFAGYDIWSNEGGPYGGQIEVLFAASSTPRALYAGTERGGIFLSQGDGAGWVMKNSGLTNTDILAVTADPLFPNIMFAGTGGGGVFRSFNSGDSWHSAGQGITSLTVNDLRYTPDGSSVYAATASGGIFRSDNSGFNWYAMNSGLTTLSVNTLAIADLDPSILYAGTSAGIFRSADAGTTWTERSNGLSFTIVGTIAVHPDDPDHAYAGTLGGGIFRTIDGGDNWEPWTDGVGTAVYVREMVFNPVRADTIWAVTNNGFFQSSNAGSLWVPFNTGLTDTTTQALLFSGDTLFCGGFWGGVFNTADPVAGWSGSNDGLTNRFVYELAVSPHDSAEIWAASYGGLSRSGDFGDSWVDSYSDIDTFDFRTVAISPDDPDVLLAGAFYGGVFRTDDGGASWTASNSGLGSFGTVTKIRYKSDDAQVVLCGTHGGFYRSTDGGSTWTWSTTGMGGHKVWGVATTEAAPSLVYAGTYGDGMFRSNDFGQNWQAISLSDPFVRALVIDPTDTAVVYAGGFYQQSGLGGIYKSIDGGGSWTPKNNGLTERSIWALAIDPNDNDHIVASTITGIFESFDGADSWAENSAGLLPEDIRWISFAGVRILAGSFGGSVPWFDRITTTIADALPEAPGRLLLGAYPNPFNPQTTIQIDSPEGPLRLAIYDIRGRLVRELMNSAYHAGGSIELIWDGRNDSGQQVPSGAYFGLAVSATETENHKLILIR